MNDFEINFHSNEDVIYGTGEWIHVYLYNFWFTWPYGYPELKNINDQGPAFRYRSLNEYDPKKPDNVDKVTEAAHNRYGTNVINNYNLPIKSNLFKGQNAGGTPKVVANKAPVVPTQKNRAEFLHYQEYFESLETSVGYGPGSLMKSATDLANALGKYEQADNFSTLSAANVAKKLPGIVTDIAIRRSCKFGIHFFVEKKGAQLHYILDGMDIQSIVDKNRMLNSSTNLHKVPICTSEIRYIFRHWNRLAATKRLLFYDKFKKVNAPWNNTSHQGTWPSWADYAIARAGKHSNGIPFVKKLAFDAAVRDFNVKRNADTARAVITTFHAIPSASVNDPADDTLRMV